MRTAYLIVLFLCSLGLAEDGWWQELFRAEDAASPPRAEITDPPVVDGSLDQGEVERGLFWMSLITGAPADPSEILAKEKDLHAERKDIVAALLMTTPLQDGDSETGPMGPQGPSHNIFRVDRFADCLDLDDIRTLVTKYQESQGRRPAGVVVGHTMVMPAVFDSGEPVRRWVDRNILSALPDTVVEWGKDVDLTKRVTWGFSRQSLSGEPSLLDRHVEESVKQVNFRVGGGLHFEVGFRRELLNNQPEDDLFEGGSGAGEPFASLMWKF